MKPLRIVHCANFSEFLNGKAYYSMDRKISFGLIQNGHLVYDFSYRYLYKVKRFGKIRLGDNIKKTNEDLIELCSNIEPDILLISKAENITSKTIETIKNMHKDIIIVQWFIDILENEKNDFFNRLQYVDTFFHTTPNPLKELSLKYNHATFAMMPNIADMAFDKDLNLEKEYDVIYLARDHKEDIRRKFAELLYDFCYQNGVKLKIYGSLGNPPVFGINYFKEISKSKIAINFNRNNQFDGSKINEIFASSDRLNHFLGAKACVFMPTTPGFDKILIDKEDIVYFNNINECFKNILYYLEDNRYKTIAQNGQKKAYRYFNAKRITKYLLDVILDKNDSLYEWKGYIYQNGKKLSNN